MPAKVPRYRTPFPNEDTLNRSILMEFFIDATVALHNLTTMCPHTEGETIKPAAQIADQAWQLLCVRRQVNYLELLDALAGELFLAQSKLANPTTKTSVAALHDRATTLMKRWPSYDFAIYKWRSTKPPTKPAT